MAAAGIALLGLIGAAWAQAVPSTRIGVASLISPEQADGHYSSSETHTDVLQLSQRPNEIRELARALRNDVDLIYDFVRNNVEIEWAYGLRKGAMGALIDRSGTAFDQAHLTVELLREAGYTASYQVGTITLTGTQFYEWSGIANATAACQLLSSSAIPASINGSTTADCNYGGANITTVTLGHIWVSVAIPGSGTYLFDPSYKPHHFIAGVNLATATGLSPGTPLSNASAGMDTGAPSGVSYVRDLDAESLTATLQGYGTSLHAYIGNNVESGSVEDVIGGHSIIRFEAPPGGLRQTALPYSSTAVQRTWSGNIPDAYRTSLNVEISKFVGGVSQAVVIERLLYVDQIYGRKLVVDTNYVAHAPGGGVTTNTFELRLTDEAGADVSSVDLGSYSASEPFLDRVGTVTLTANHPYASAADGSTSISGDYMDATVVKPVYMLLPFTILNAWGDANTGLADAWGQRDDTTLPAMISPACETCTMRYRQSAGDGRREQLTASWMVQASRAARLHAEIGDGVYNHHRSLGVVIGDAQPRQDCYATPDCGYIPPQQRTYWFSIVDNFDRIDVEEAFSYIDRDANAADRRAAIFAIAATREALEASVSGQISDLPDISSTATRFDWGNRPAVGEDPSGGYGPRRFYRFDASNASNAFDLARSEGQTTTSGSGGHACNVEPTIGSSETLGRRNRLASAISQYADASFDVVASEEAFLGPGQRGGGYYGISSGGVIVGCEHYDSMQRGGALVAVRSVNGEPVEIAHVIVGPRFNAKGGGGGAQTTHEAQYDPSAAADILRSRFVDRSSAVGVDLNTGGLTYASPAELSVGNGGFPYSLSANLIWRGGFVPSGSFGPNIHTQPSTPWTSNWHNMLSVSASGLEAMGETDARAAAGTIAAFLAQQDIYRASYSPQREAAALLVGAWWLRQISGNVVTVSVGADTRQFVRNVNGQYVSPGAAAYAALTQTGSRTPGVYRDPACDPGAIGYVPTRGWLYGGISFQVTHANGETQTFTPWNQAVLHVTSYACAAQLRGFRMTSWTFPQGVTANLSYQQIDEFSAPVLTEVSNSLGRRIRFNYEGSWNQFRWTGFDNGLAGGDLRSVSIASTGGLQTISSITDAGGAQTRFTTGEVGNETVLTEVFDADDTSTPSLRYTYDTLGRVMEVRDAVALQGARDPYEFRIAAGARGEREDPLGNRYTVLSNFYDSNGARWRRFIDELGRETNARFDGRGRIDRYVYPELDEEQLLFDSRNRVVRLTRVPQPGAGQSAIEINATWDDVWNKPSRIIDARGCHTDFVYGSSGASAGQIVSATRPAPTGAAPCTSGTRPVYSFTYGAFGRVATTTDPTGLVVSNAVNGTNGDIASTTLDPTGVNATTTFAHDAIGDRITATDPRGNATSTTYDAMRRPTLMRRHDGGAGAALLAAERSNYNLLGQVASTEVGTDFSGTNVTAWLTREARTYTPTGQVATATLNPGSSPNINAVTTNTYDGLDRLLSVTDPVGRVTRNEYDAAGQLARVIRADGSALEQDYARYTYSANGQRLSVRDANDNRSEYVYDGFDRLIGLHFPVAALGVNQASATDWEGYGYDPNGNRTSLRLRSGEEIAFSFDNLNRETLRDIPGGSATDVYSAYDLAGRRLSARFGSAGGQGVVYDYDSAGRLESETSFARMLSFEHDTASNRTRLHWPGSTPASPTNFVEYIYDKLNRVDLIQENGSTALADYDYDAQGRRATLARGDGTVTSFAYDNASRLTGLAHDVAGGSDSDQNLGFQYTSASQISQRTAANDNYTWPAPAANRTYARNGLNQYTSTSGTGAATFAHDERGNLIGDGSRTFGYDLENRLISVNGSAFQLDYDPLGRLLQTTAPAGTTQFLYDGDRLVAEYDGVGTLLRRYVHGPGVDEPLVWYQCANPPDACVSDRRYLIADHQGSIIAESGAGVTRYAYGPYGEPDTWSGARFRYTGQIMLPEVGLYHYKARAYWAEGGRFLQTDPVGYEDQLNLYAYVYNDPLNNTDPTGRCGPLTPVCVAVAACAESGVCIAAAVALTAATAAGIKNAWDHLTNNNEQADPPADQPDPDAPSGLGDLTNGEAGQIQGVVDAAGRPIAVVGSAAGGTRGEGSDIDYVAGPSSLPNFEGQEGNLPGIDPEHGIIPGVPNPHQGPAIQFEPGAPPTVIPAEPPPPPPRYDR